jgi:small GTP-binding protein
MSKSHKVVFAGTSAVGKTCLILRYAKQDFSEFTAATVGSDVFPVTVEVKGPNGNITVPLSLTDTAGQEKYRSLSAFFFRGATAACLCYDITSRASLDELHSFYQVAKDGGESDCKFVLVGTKADLDDKREVQASDAEALATEFGAIFTAETSSKTGEGVEDLMTRIAQALSQDTAGGKTGPALDVTAKHDSAKEKRKSLC